MSRLGSEHTKVYLYQTLPFFFEHWLPFQLDADIISTSRVAWQEHAEVCQLSVSTCVYEPQGTGGFGSHQTRTFLCEPPAAAG